MQKLDNSFAMNQQALMDMFDKLNTTLRNACYAKAGLAIGTGSAKAVKIANTVTYTNAGAMCSKTTAEVAFTATTHDIAADPAKVKEAVFLLCLIADGTATLHMGDIAEGSGNAKVPEVPAGKTPIGYVRIAVAAGATGFDATTDDLSASHITDTYVDYGPMLPMFGTEL